MSEIPLPAFSESFKRKINGETLKAFTSKKRGYTLHLGLNDEYNGYYGLYINEETQCAYHKFTDEEFYYAAGSTHHANAYDNEGLSEISTDREFEDWIISQLFRLYDQAILDALCDLNKEHTKTEAYTFLQEMDVLAEKKESFILYRSYYIISICSSIYQIHKNQTYTETCITRILDFYKECDERYWSLQRYRQLMESFAHDFLPAPFPQELADYFAQRTK
jgi:hypothetical protein